MQTSQHSSPLVHLVSSMLQIDPASRPEMEEVDLQARAALEHQVRSLDQALCWLKCKAGPCVVPCYGLTQRADGAAIVLLNQLDWLVFHITIGGSARCSRTDAPIRIAHRMVLAQCD